MKPYDSFKVGDRVCFARQMSRQFEHPNRIFWVAKSYPGVGTYVGYRYKQNGVARFNGEYTEWDQEGTVLVAMVVLDPRQDPIPVDFSGMTLEADG